MTLPPRPTVLSSQHQYSPATAVREGPLNHPEAGERQACIERLADVAAASLTTDEQDLS